MSFSAFIQLVEKFFCGNLIGNKLKFVALYVIKLISRLGLRINFDNDINSRPLKALAVKMG